MVHFEFKIAISKEVWIPFLILASVLESALIMISFYPKYVPLYLFLAIIFFAIAFVVVYCTLLFYVKVENRTIYVRTRLGKRYIFNCSDIEEVICSKRIGRYGPSYYITLLAKSHKLTMEGTMTGFQIMAGYLLDKYESGEIKRNAISEDSREILLKFKNGEYKKKKKNK